MNNLVFFKLFVDFVQSHRLKALGEGWVDSDGTDVAHYRVWVQLLVFSERDDLGCVEIS